jgi:DNA-directed RNA polymerase sigma subunit (sigma70/sigma32)
MAKADPRHQLACADFTRLEAVEAKRRMGITDYQAGDYVASEVLASVIRSRFGQDNGVMDMAASALFSRIVRCVNSYLAKNSRWHRIVRASSETRKEIVSYIWEKLLTDKSSVSFAEVRFLPFVEARTGEYLLSRCALKNQVNSLDARRGRDEEGRQRPALELIEDDTGESTEAATMRAQTSEALQRGLLALEPIERRAVYFYVLQECDWDLTAKYLGCSITTAKKHLERGLEKLRGVQYED